MGKSTSTPPPPDYVGAANATAAGNINAAKAQAGLADVNTVNPYGSQTWSQTAAPQAAVAPPAPQAGAPGTTNIGNPPTSGFGAGIPYGSALSYGGGYGGNYGGGYGTGSSTSVPQPGSETLTTALNPTQQGLFNTATGVQTELGNNATANLGNYENLINNGINTSGDVGIVTGVPGTNLTTQGPSAGTQTGQINSSGVTPLSQTGYQSSLNLSSAPAFNAGQQNTNLNFSNLNGAMPTAGNGIDSGAYNAALNTQLQTLNPQIAQSQEAMKSQLAAQGIQPGSAAWNTQMNNLNTSNNQAMNLAQNTALTTGAQIGQGNYANQLAGYNTLMNQDVTGGNFTNSAIQGNNAANLASNQNAVQNLLSQGNFANTSANSANAANLASNNQSYSQALANAGLSNTAQTQQLNNQLASLGFGNNAQTQQMANALQNAGLTNSANQQQFGQAQTEQGTQVSQLGSNIQGASQYQMPSFGTGQQSTQSIGGPDYTGAAQGAYNAALNSSNAQNASNNATTSGLVSLAAMAAMYF